YFRLWTFNDRTIDCNQTFLDQLADIFAAADIGICKIFIESDYKNFTLLRIFSARSPSTSSASPVLNPINRYTITPTGTVMTKVMTEVILVISSILIFIINK